MNKYGIETASDGKLRPMRLRRFAALFAALLCALLCFAGCTGNGGTQDGTTQSGNITAAPSADGQYAENTEQPALHAPEGMPSADEIVEPAARVWRYLDDPVRLGRISDTSWAETGFDDSDWASAAGRFGANEGRLEALSEDCVPNVCLRHYGPDGRTMPVYYFRLAFYLEPGRTPEPLTAEIFYDDAAVIYVNGRAACSCNVPEGGYASPNAYGCEKTYSDPESKVITLDAGLFNEGVNVLAVELHQSDEHSSDIYFAVESLYFGSTEDILRGETVCLGVGAENGEMLVTWQGPIYGGACVEVTSADDAGFANEKGRYPAEAVYADEAAGICTYRAKMTGLAPGDYLYRVSDSGVSAVYGFSVAEEGGGMTFICQGDPQIVDAHDAEPLAAYGALAEKLTELGEPRFILSLGDQSDDADAPELFRSLTAVPLLKTVPTAAVVGNHEKGHKEFSRFFYMPNMDAATEDTSGDMSGDYWFFRENTLFLCLNSNNGDTDAHRDFMLSARAECAETFGEPRWTVAAMHISLFSAGRHADDAGIIENREAYSDAFAAAGVDVVFAGHDHSFTRTCLMNGTSPAAEGGDGIIYFTLGSSTGSKMYDLCETLPDYAAFATDVKYPAMTKVDVTDAEFTVSTYGLVGGELVLLDAYTLTKGI